MINVPVSKAQAGMTLAKDAVNAQQMLLLKKGSVLSEKSLRMLKSWGVEVICIQASDADDPDSNRSPSAHTDIADEMAVRFGDTIENPVMAEICKAAIEIVHQRTQNT